MIRYTFALAGNQNSGKTTLFNLLTGSNQHVGNWPGVTVEQKTGLLDSRQQGGSEALSRRKTTMYRLWICPVFTP